MKNMVKLVRVSSKEAFNRLRSTGKIYCKDIDKYFEVTNLFLRHISWNATKRSLWEIIQRLSSINLIEKISFEWKLVEKRKNVVIEWKRKFDMSYKIRLDISDIEFFIILWEKKDKKLILISIFLNFKTKK